jgi:hypothetical protein
MELTASTELLIRVMSASGILVVLATIVALAVFLFQTRDAPDAKKRGPVARLQDALGLDRVPPPLVVLAAFVWTVIACLLLMGLVGLVLDIATQAVIPQAAPSDGTATANALRTEQWAFRFRLAQLVALTTVLGAVIALPITLKRLQLAREAADHAEATLFNQKITDAAADLYAQRQVTRWAENNKAENGWEDDIVRRNAAIDRLEGLVAERPEEAERVSRLLSGYVREISRQNRAAPHPSPDSDASDTNAWRKFEDSLPPAPTDIDRTMKALGGKIISKNYQQTPTRSTCPERTFNAAIFPVFASARRVFLALTWNAPSYPVRSLMNATLPKPNLFAQRWVRSKQRAAYSTAPAGGLLKLWAGHSREGLHDRRK